MNNKPSLHDVVALLSDVPEHNLSRGQVGTVVELLTSDTTLIEFSGDDGRAYAITPVKFSQVLLLHYEPEAA